MTTYVTLKVEVEPSEDITALPAPDVIGEALASHLQYANMGLFDVGPEGETITYEVAEITVEAAVESDG